MELARLIAGVTLHSKLRNHQNPSNGTKRRAKTTCPTYLRLQTASSCWCCLRTRSHQCCCSSRICLCQCSRWSQSLSLRQIRHGRGTGGANGINRIMDGRAQNMSSIKRRGCTYHLCCWRCYSRQTHQSRSIGCCCWSRSPRNRRRKTFWCLCGQCARVAGELTSNAQRNVASGAEVDAAGVRMERGGRGRRR